MSRIVVTGATSMIGGALVSHALGQGDEVTAIIRPDSNRKNGLPFHEKLSVVECAMSDYKNLTLKDIVGGDAFFHLAWAHTSKEGRDDVQVQHANIGYALDAADLAGKLGCRVFVGAGSQAEYGFVAENLGPGTRTNPQSGYGIAKYAAGKLSALACSQKGVSHSWARILSVYGPGDNPGSLISYCASSLLRGEIPALTPCDQIWDYIYCGDAARALYLIGKSGRNQAVYCIGGGRVRPLREYIEILRDQISPNLPLGFGERPYYPNQPMYLCADIHNLTGDTGFVPWIDFKEGIAETIDWMKHKGRAV